ncbi:heterokaryon incompatibility protein [Paraphaeosphaeria sporulosa]
MPTDAPEPAPAEFLESYQRRVAWGHLRDGVQDGELCTPCQLAVDEGDYRRIGTAAWLNNGFVNCEHLDEPLNYCSLCRHILRARERASEKGIVDNTPDNIELDWMGANIFCHDKGTDLDGDDTVLRDFRVKKCQSSRSIQRDLVEIDRIQSWLNECESQHIEEGCNRHRDEAKNERNTLLLIDVQNDCLVQGHFSDRFFALSYVWGTSQQFLTLQSNYPGLLEKGSLLTQPITQTILDSMTLVRSLGEQYLWVDTMCIIQDDVINKATAITQMSSIYSCAVATIICFSGNSADAGLSGISPTTRNKSAVYIAPGLSVIKRPNLKLDSTETEYIYHTRAWTFQEQLLSNRSIIFLEEQVYFQCKRELLSEDSYVHSAADRTYLQTTLESVRLTSENKKKRNKLYSPIEDFQWYEEFVPEYTARKMGYPADIINAFTGVQTQLSKLFGWRFTAGLPIQLFDLALLWTPINSVVRRVTELPHPSWSWSGWIGCVHYKDVPAYLNWPGGLPLGDSFLRKSSNLEIDTKSSAVLHFEGEVVTLDAFSLKQSEKQLINTRANLPVTPHIHFVYNQFGRCGIFYGLQSIDNITDHEGSFRLLRLSEWQTMLQDGSYHGPCLSYLVENGYEHKEKLFDEIFEDTRWSTLNVMCVQRSRGTWQRVAVGHVHTHAWRDAGPVREKLEIR